LIELKRTIPVQYFLKDGKIFKIGAKVLHQLGVL